MSAPLNGEFSARMRVSRAGRGWRGNRRARNHRQGVRRGHNSGLPTAKSTAVRVLFVSPCSESEPLRALLQLCVLRFRLLQDRNIGIGVFPEGEKIPVGGESPGVGSVGFNSLVDPRL